MHGICIGKVATLSCIEGLKDDMYRKVVSERKAYNQISRELQHCYPSVRGISARSVRRYCSINGIKRTSRIADHEIERVVATNIAKVRRTITYHYFPLFFKMVNGKAELLKLLFQVK